MADEVAHRIVQNIRQQGLTLGDKLPPEREMLEQYEVGRGTLREALRYLEFQGVLTIRPGPNGGPMVSEPASIHLSSTLGLLLQFSNAAFSHLLEARQALEPRIAALAASRIDDESLSVLRDSVEKMRRDLDDRDVFFQENARFHDVIAWSSGNPLFGHLVESLHGVTDGANLGAEFPPDRRGRVADAHEEILRSLEARDPLGAEHAMEDHVSATLRYTRKVHPDLFSRTLNWDHFSR